MMTLLLLSLLTSSAHAQQQQSPVEQSVKAQMGELLFNSSVLAGQVQQLQQENAKLKAEIEQLKGTPPDKK